MNMVAQKGVVINLVQDHKDKMPSNLSMDLGYFYGVGLVGSSTTLVMDQKLNVENSGNLSRFSTSCDIFLVAITLMT